MLEYVNAALSVYDFDIMNAVLPPKKADPPLIVDADAVHRQVLAD